jgi:phosphatidylserine/phosphatidylglycerophosphate/cardiolipin synthase-like enzyme
VKITPLLTPDNLPSDPQEGQYLANILQLVASAQHSLYIQLQYIEASKDASSGNLKPEETAYGQLLQAIADRVAAGVDVRLIESLQYGEKWAEKMKAAGVDLTANISLQSNVNNKGFVVDSRPVVVSSQNFSPSGVRTNRDAGVIIENADIAQYFRENLSGGLAKQSQKVCPPRNGGRAGRRGKEWLAKRCDDQKIGDKKNGHEKSDDFQARQSGRLEASAQEGACELSLIRGDRRAQPRLPDWRTVRTGPHRRGNRLPTPRRTCIASLR